MTLNNFVRADRRPCGHKNPLNFPSGRERPAGRGSPVALKRADLPATTASTKACPLRLHHAAPVPRIAVSKFRRYRLTGTCCETIPKTISRVQCICLCAGRGRRRIASGCCALREVEAISAHLA